MESDPVWVVRPAFQRGAGLSSPSSVPLLPAQMCVLGLFPAEQALRGPATDPGLAQAPPGARALPDVTDDDKLVDIQSQSEE